jgi:hypothetical protein
MKNYVIFEIEYINYTNMKGDKVKIKYNLTEPQIDLERSFIMAIKDFYIKNSSCDIINITVIANAAFN